MNDFYSHAFREAVVIGESVETLHSIPPCVCPGSALQQKYHDITIPFGRKYRVLVNKCDGRISRNFAETFNDLTKNFDPKMIA